MTNKNKGNRRNKKVLISLLSVILCFIVYATADYIIEKSMMSKAVNNEIERRGWSEKVASRDMQFNSKTGTFSQLTTFKDDEEGMSYDVFFIEEPTFSEKFLFRTYKPKTFISESSKDNEFQTNAKYNVIPDIED